MYKFNNLLDVLEAEIARLPLSKEPLLLYEPIKYLLEAGGKRIRPVLMLMSHNLFCNDISKSINAAIAVELFHNFTLLHDDIMDNAFIRRGRPTANRKWDNNVAILSGDTMTIMAYQYLLKSPEESVIKVMDVFNKFAIEICEGQRYDMDFESIDEVCMQQYIEMIRLKTSVLMAGAMQIGAVIGGADDSTAEKLYMYGESVGLAFQLSDDYLDTYGDAETFGKSIGGDIIEGKKTFLYLTTLLNAPVQEREQIISLFKSSDMDRDEKIKKVKSCYSQYGADKILTEEIEKYYIESQKILDSIDIDENKKQELRNIAIMLIKRDK